MTESGGVLEIDVQQISRELRIRPEIYIKILTSFSQTLFDKTKILEEAIGKYDKETIRRTLHEIKGTASNLRLKTITAVEEELHQEVKGTADVAKLKQGLQELVAETEKLKSIVPTLKI
jgi:HPt (histidine-containing phosphotransfer) domain-containing protein